MTSSDFDPRGHAPQPGEFHGRVVMVTGAGAGIGRAVALALAGAGAEVILLGRTGRKLEGVHAEIVIGKVSLHQSEGGRTNNHGIGRCESLKPGRHVGRLPQG